jgi:hypothetical protein
VPAAASDKDIAACRVSAHMAGRAIEIRCPSHLGGSAQWERAASRRRRRKHEAQGRGRDVWSHVIAALRDLCRPGTVDVHGRRAFPRTDPVGRPRDVDITSEWRHRAPLDERVGIFSPNSAAGLAPSGKAMVCDHFPSNRHAKLVVQHREDTVPTLSSSRGPEYICGQEMFFGVPTQSDLRPLLCGRGVASFYGSRRPGRFLRASVAALLSFPLATVGCGASAPFRTSSGALATQPQQVKSVSTRPVVEATDPASGLADVSIGNSSAEGAPHQNMPMRLDSSEIQVVTVRGPRQTSYVFFDLYGPVTENDFARRYRTATVPTNLAVPSGGETSLLSSFLPLDLACHPLC